MVFGHPGRDYVHRLCHTPCRQDSWLDYALWAQANWTRSPAIPRIDRIVRFQSGSFFTFLAKVERLSPLTESQLEHTRNVWLAFSEFRSPFHTPEDIRRATESLPASTRWAMQDIRRNFVDGGGHYTDLLTSNLMLRASDKQVVLIDPITEVP